TTTHPARCAERIAALDLVSNGRVEFGTGESASITELEPFGVNFDEKRAIWEEGIRAVIPMLTQDRVEHHGKYFDMPLRNVVPKPVQKPHPPLWVACSALETIEMAGRRGIGALAFQFLSADAAHAWVHAYYNDLHEAAEEARRLCDEPEHRDRQLFHVRRNRRRGAAPRRRNSLLPIRLALLRAAAGPEKAGARHGQCVGRIRE